MNRSFPAKELNGIFAQNEMGSFFMPTSGEAVLYYLSIYWEISLLASLNLGQAANVTGAP